MYVMQFYVQLYVQEAISRCLSRRKGGIARAIFWGRERSKRVVAKPQRQFSISTEQVSQQVRTTIFHSFFFNTLVLQAARGRGNAVCMSEIKECFLYCYMAFVTCSQISVESHLKKKYINCCKVLCVCTSLMILLIIFQFYFDKVILGMSIIRTWEREERERDDPDVAVGVHYGVAFIFELVLLYM